MVRLSQDYYRQKGEGRPTKKDRRAIDDYLDDDFFNSDHDDKEYWEQRYTNQETGWDIGHLLLL